MTFIVSIGGAIDVVVQTDRAQTPQRYGCVLSGLQATPALIAHGGTQEGVVIELTPLGSRALFGMPAGALWNQSLELHDVVGATGRELWERLQGTTSWDERFAACDALLSRLTTNDDGGAVMPELAFAWASVVASGGGMPVGEIAGKLGWSRQHLARRFRTEFGLGPKLASRVVRFERAKQMLEQVPSFVSIAQVAAACGYYDQAHLDRDFAELAGCTPTELIAGDVPVVQDGNEPDPSPLGHEHEQHLTLVRSDVP